MTPRRRLKVFCPFIGLGSGADGFRLARPAIKGLDGHWDVVGGIDSDSGAVNNASRILRARITCADLFSREQYIAFHGCEPPEGWKELTPDDIRAAAGGEFPDLIFTSPPCKGFSGLTSESKSKTDPYVALNMLGQRALFLCLEAFKDDLPAFILMENVPRMRTRGRHWLDQMNGMLSAYRYATAETTHDCGEVGGLAQSRRRFLMVSRNIDKIPNYLYQPPKKPLRAVGDVLDQLPVPGAADELPLHRLPALQWKTWVRLAFVEAGKDWRSLRRLTVENGVLRDYGLIPERPYFAGALGVRRWIDTSGAITSESRPPNGAFAVADPRFNDGGNEYGQYGVGGWSEAASTVINTKSPGQGRYSVADPRLDRVAFNHAFRVARFDSPSPAVHSGECAVADPRPHDGPLFAKYAVSSWSGNTGTVIGGTDQGACAVADPRWHKDRSKGYITGGHYGVVPWESTAYAVTGSGQHDNGYNSVADPRGLPAGCGNPLSNQLPAPNDKLRCVILAEDGTWHRPFTTLENAALQSLFDLDEYQHFKLTGATDSRYREWIGNAVPRDAARILGEVFGQALLLAGSGETFILSNTPIWVREQIAALQCGGASGEGC